VTKDADVRSRGLPTVDVSDGLGRAFAAQVARDPDATAIVTEERAATFGELAGQVDALVPRLRPIAGRPMIVAPVDPIALAGMVLAAERVGSGVVLADPQLTSTVLSGLAGRVGAGAIVVDGLTPMLIDRTVRAAQQLDGAAIWIPTSGTSGDPQLIGVTTTGLLTMANQVTEMGLLQPTDRVARLATHIGIGPLLSALLLGLPYVALDVRTRRPSDLLPWLERHGVTYLHLAPTLLRTVLRAPSECRERWGIRLVGSGGEMLRWDDVTRVRRALGDDVTVLHTYSSTEAGMVTARFVTPEDAVGVGPVPIGRAVPGRDVWIDDGSGAPASASVTGEIVVDGHLHTVAPRISGLPDGRQRLRTGDLGALDRDGSLVLHGRVARDAKIGLWRVDLEAVESAIGTVEGIVDVAVHRAGTEGPSSRALVAHVVVAPGAVVTDDLLRSAVKALASSAVPQRFVRHHAPFPLLASGKLDVSSLVAQAGDRAMRAAPTDP